MSDEAPAKEPIVGLHDSIQHVDAPAPAPEPVAPAKEPAPGHNIDKGLQSVQQRQAAFEKTVFAKLEELTQAPAAPQSQNPGLEAKFDKFIDLMTPKAPARSEYHRQRMEKAFEGQEINPAVQEMFSGLMDELDRPQTQLDEYKATIQKQIADGIAEASEGWRAGLTDLRYQADYQAQKTEFEGKYPGVSYEETLQTATEQLTTEHGDEWDKAPDKIKRTLIKQVLASVADGLQTDVAELEEATANPEPAVQARPEGVLPQIGDYDGRDPAKEAFLSELTNDPRFINPD